MALVEDGTKQVMAREATLFCGAANCTMWLFVREAGHLRAVLQTGGTSLEIRDTATLGFRDVVASVHISASAR